MPVLPKTMESIPADTFIRPSARRWTAWSRMAEALSEPMTAGSCDLLQIVSLSTFWKRCRRCPGADAVKLKETLSRFPLRKDPNSDSLERRSKGLAFFGHFGILCRCLYLHFEIFCCKQKAIYKSMPVSNTRRNKSIGSIDLQSLAECSMFIADCLYFHWSRRLHLLRAGH